VSAERPLTATYRLQLNAAFTLAKAREQVDYFSRLGVSHLYLSPVLAARRGSMHGYDVIDPTRINPELGDELGLRALADDLHARGMGIVLDIVPNHMGIGAENPYWDDVLTHGERSRYAKWFDIDWTPDAAGHRKLVLPVLGDELDRVLERGELSVRVREGEPPRIAYFDNSFPLEPASLPPELQLAAFDPEETGELANLFSGTAGRDRLRQLLAQQHYELVFWRRGPAEINYRRFFDVNDLAALRMEDEEVLQATHALLLRLVSDGVVDGVRVDHIDGLLDPLAYLQRLRAAVKSDTFVVVEKILSPGEQLRSSWPIQGATGYEYLNDLEDVFIDPVGFAKIEKCYRTLRRLGETSFHDVAAAGKKAVLQGALMADVTRLVRAFSKLSRGAGKRWSPDEHRTALVEFIAALPVYRTYIDGHPSIDDSDRTLIERAAAQAAQTNVSVAEQIAFLRDLLLDRVAGADAAARLRLAMRLQQVSGPATAKGVEDTALYAYAPLASRNEVGGAPDRPLENAVAQLHEANHIRASRWPFGLTVTNTHDTKRSADVRARIDVLSEMPQEWERCVRRWRKLNAKHRRAVKGRMAPDTNAEYLLYQTLIALWPPPRAGRRSDDLPDRTWRDTARTRLSEYMLKAAREAKIRTSWVDPNADYEEALRAFVAAVLEPGDGAPFLTDVARIVSRIATAAAWNSLARIALHLTSPGTPDTYQGDECWNFTLVDPDNRQQVDFAARSNALGSLTALDTSNVFDHRAKLLVTHKLLQLRRERAELFREGSYEPLVVRGARAQNVVAFARRRGEHNTITIAGRLTCALAAEQNRHAWWCDTTVELPDDLRGRHWGSRLFSGDVGTVNALELASVLDPIPVAVLAD
jgi:(1->4)-alpha-D-glucan 1-alpha-D-glucosylmutase